MNSNKRAAMEMSVGTIVTIVLLMTVLILGLVLVRTIFRGSIENIESIDEAVKNEIRKLFSEDASRKVVVFPSSRQITLKKGDDPKGFAFSVKNQHNEEKFFTYSVKADPAFDFSKCGSAFVISRANDWLLIGSGSFTLGESGSMELPELVLFDIPETAPLCTIPYNLKIDLTNPRESYSDVKVFITIK